MEEGVNSVAYYHKRKKRGKVGFIFPPMTLPLNREEGSV
jgi:hypothetical protein